MKIQEIEFNTHDLSRIVAFLSDILLFDIQEIENGVIMAEKEGLRLKIFKNTDPSQLKLTFSDVNLPELLHRIELSRYRGKNLGVITAKTEQSVSWLDFEGRSWIFQA